MLLTFLYGPSQRIFVVPEKTADVRSARELEDLWHTSGVHGRVAVLFARHLVSPLAFNTFPEIDYLDRAMNQGIIRKAYCVIPDRLWNEVITRNMESPSLTVKPRFTDDGYTVLRDGGRIQFIRLSGYIPDQSLDKALVVIESALWSPQERARIEGFLRTGQLSSDFVIVVTEEMNYTL